MNGIGKGCRKYRQNINLLASGVLAESERQALEQHLTGCEDCRVRLQEIRIVTQSFRQLKKDFAQVVPSEEAQTRWKKEIKNAVKASDANSTRGNFLQEAWRGLIWPRRYAWTTLLALWIFMAALNWERPQTLRSSSAVNVAGTATFLENAREEQRLLTELIPPAPDSPVESPRRMDGPRTERRTSWAAC